MSEPTPVFADEPEDMRPPLTTQQAADLLNVSQEYMLRLLDEGAVPFIKTYGHHRLRREDVLAYKEQRDANREADLTELVRITEQYGGYDELKKPATFELMLGESVAKLRTLPAEHYDAVITDPPYASGGLHIGNRQATT